MTKAGHIFWWRHDNWKQSASACEHWCHVSCDIPYWKTMTFDFDLWPTDLIINRDYQLIKGYPPTKFEVSGAKHSWVIGCTRLRETDISTDRHTDQQVHSNIITDSVVLWKIQKFDWLIPETKWHSCLHNRALCSYLATLRLLRQRENNPQFLGTY